MSKKKLFVWVIGANGSGKSAWGKRLQALDDEAYTFEGKIRPGKTLGTVFPTLGWAALGRYSGKTCGSDNLKSNDLLEEAVTLLAESPYNVYIEGMSLQGSRERWWNRMHEILQKTNRKGLIVGLDYPFEVSHARYLARNNGKAEKLELPRFRNVQRTFEIFENRPGIPFYRETTEGLEEMLASLESRFYATKMKSARKGCLTLR